jgi:hypothetical protein
VLGYFNGESIDNSVVGRLVAGELEEELILGYSLNTSFSPARSVHVFLLHDSIDEVPFLQVSSPGRTVSV